MRLHLLGELRLIGPDGTDLTPRGRKARAALAFAALSPSSSASRDQLAAMLWADRPDDQARASLRQSLQELRRAFDPVQATALQIDRDRVRLMPDQIWIDAVEVGELLASTEVGAPSRAAALWRGELLANLALRSPEFDNWLRLEREAQRRRLIDALTTALSLAERDGADEAARSLAFEVVRLEPANERAHCALIRYHQRRGERSQALHQYMVLRERLAHELDMVPSPATEALVAGLRAAGTNGVDPDSAAPLAAPGPTRERPSVLVLPLDNISGDPAEDYLIDGLTDDLITTLGRFKELLTLGRHSSFIYKGRHVDLREVARDLKVDYVLQGSLRRLGEQLRLNVHLSATGSRHQVWAERFDVPMSEVADLMDGVVARVMAALLPAVEVHEARAVRTKSDDQLAAYDFYLQGKQLLYRSPGPLEAEQARLLLERAIELDPGLFFAYGHLTRLYNTDMLYTTAGGPLERGRARAFQLARHALALEPNSALAHFSMGWCRLWRREWATARGHFERIEQLNPFDPHRLTDIATGFMCLGDHPRALAHMERAMLVNPSFPEDYLADLADIRFGLEDFEEAVELLARVQHQTAWRRSFRISALGHLGRVEEARYQAQLFVEQIRAIWRGPPDAGAQAFVDWMMAHLPFAQPADEARMRTGLMLAGLPA